MKLCPPQAGGKFQINFSILAGANCRVRPTKLALHDRDKPQV